MIIPLPKEENKSPSQHWYTMQAEACHWQSDGKPTTLRHARKQKLVPSVSGVLNLIEKPRITKFKCDEMVKQCLQYPHEEGESEKEGVGEGEPDGGTGMGEGVDEGEGEEGERGRDP